MALYGVGWDRLPVDTRVKRRLGLWPFPLTFPPERIPVAPLTRANWVTQYVRTAQAGQVRGVTPSQEYQAAQNADIGERGGHGEPI